DALDSTSSASNLVINVTDADITAKGEVHVLTEDADVDSVTGGNVMSNETGVFDADASFVGWSSTTAQYGTFTANDNGTYSYQLDNDNATVNALNTGSAALTETFTYTVKDADGSSSEATVTITINGHTDGVPTVSVKDENAAEAGHQTIAENEATPVAGIFTVTADAGLKSISVSGTAITEAQLLDLADNPVVIETPLGGELTITGFNAGNGEVSYTYVVNKAISHTAGAAEADSLAITVTDALDSTSSASNLVINVTDADITAKGEVHVLTEDADVDSVTGGNVMS
ncbi:MAG: adhesin, partial [Colwellia sp.]|nr:adhesin [Colwellia sp.]